MSEHQNGGDRNAWRGHREAAPGNDARRIKDLVRKAKTPRTIAEIVKRLRIEADDDHGAHDIVWRTVLDEDRLDVIWAGRRPLVVWVEEGDHA